MSITVHYDIDSDGVGDIDGLSTFSNLDKVWERGYEKAQVFIQEELDASGG